MEKTGENPRNRRKPEEQKIVRKNRIENERREENRR